MKFTTAVVAVLATVATASPFAAHNGTSGAMPKCAYQCLERIIKKATDCSVDDFNCLCLKKNQAEVMKYAPRCIFRACNTAEALKAKAVASAQCKAVRKAAEALANNTAVAQNTTLHARTFLAHNTTVHGMAAIAQNFTAKKTFVSA